MNAKHAAALRIVAWAALPICLATMQVQAAPPTAGQTASSKTTTATPRKLTIAKLGDFESGEMVSEKDDVGWAAYKFAQGSTLPQSTASIVAGGSGASKKALRFEGNIPDNAQMAFIGLGCGFGGTTDDPQRVDLSAYKGIRFKMRGDENPYRLAVLTDAVKDYNYHGLNIVAEKEWTSVDVPFAELKQTEGWGTPVPFDPKHVRVLSISTMYQATGPAWFEIDDVELYK
jgi:hypothetical protein